MRNISELRQGDVFAVHNLLSVVTERIVMPGYSTPTQVVEYMGQLLDTDLDTKATAAARSICLQHPDLKIELEEDRVYSPTQLYKLLGALGTDKALSQQRRVWPVDPNNIPHPILH